MMKYLIFAVTALFAAECALAQTTTTPPPEPGKPPATQPAKPAATQPAPATGTAAAAKNVGTKDKTAAADAYLKAQEKKKTARAKKQASQGNSGTAAVDTGVRAASLMTDEERAEHRKKLQSFTTLDECEKYEKDYHAKAEARAKEQHKTLQPSNAGACNRYKVAASTPATAVAKPVSDAAKPATK